MINLIADALRYDGPKCSFKGDWGTSNRRIYDGEMNCQSNWRGAGHPQSSTSWWSANVFIEDFYND